MATRVSAANRIAAVAALVAAASLTFGYSTLFAWASQDQSAAATAEPVQAPESVPLAQAELAFDSFRLGVPRSQAAGQATNVDGAVYLWKDGDRSMQILYQPDLMATQDATPRDIVIARSAAFAIVQKANQPRGDSLPVFRSPSGELMTLPGGVLIVFDRSMSRSEIDGVLARHDLASSSTSELGMPNGFLLETEPGFPSLDFANLLAREDGVEVSSPNWWRERVTK